MNEFTSLHRLKYMQKTVIIVAGGQGIRFRQDLPKQFYSLRGKPLLMHCIERFHSYDKDVQIITGIQDNRMPYWRDLCNTSRFNVPHELSSGGRTRYHTVKNALQMVTPGNLVAVHDAVRPLFYKRTLADCYEAAEKFGAALPCIEIHDSIREIIPKGSRGVNRDVFRRVQTPQIFRYDILTRGYQQAYSKNYTDDASLVETAGFPVVLVDGNPENIKITTEQDLVFAEAIFDSYWNKCGFPDG